tara:strand:- start:189 stop:1067 length:879 start_codon:yes stop_codon:yes gene_type:complete
MWKFEELKRANGNLTEGPVWDGKNILFTDGRENRILRFDPSTNNISIDIEGTFGVNGLNYNSKGELFGCEQKGRRIVRYENGKAILVADKLYGKRLNAPNDLAIDLEDNIWFSDQISSIDNKPDLHFSSVIKASNIGSGNYKTERMTFDCSSPNGILFSADYKKLFVAQSDFSGNQRRQLRSYPILDSETLGKYEILHDFGPHRGIDGMTLDSEGNILATCGWEISGPGPMIYIFNPKGRIIETVRTPCMRPSNITFGGKDLADIYVTSLEGHLYRIRNSGLKGSLLYPKGD